MHNGHDIDSNCKIYKAIARSIDVCIDIASWL